MPRNYPTLRELEEQTKINFFGYAEIPLENPYPENPKFTEGYELLKASALREVRRLALRRYNIYKALWGEE